MRTLFTLMSKFVVEIDQCYKSLFPYCLYFMYDDLRNMFPDTVCKLVVLVLLKTFGH